MLAKRKVSIKAIAARSRATPPGARVGGPRAPEEMAARERGDDELRVVCGGELFVADLTEARNA